MVRSKKVVSMLLAAVVAITNIPVRNVTAAEQSDVERTGHLAEESKFLVTFDSETGGIVSMKLDNDPNKGNSDLELNWANGSKNTSANGQNFGDTTWGMGPLYNAAAPTALEITDTKSEAVFQTEDTKVEIVRELKEDSSVIEETYTFTNTSDTPVRMRREIWEFMCPLTITMKQVIWLQSEDAIRISGQARIIVISTQ